MLNYPIYQDNIGFNSSQKYLFCKAIINFTKRFHICVIDNQRLNME